MLYPARADCWVRAFASMYVGVRVGARRAVPGFRPDHDALSDTANAAVKYQERPSPTGVRGQAFFTGQALRER